MKMTDKKFSRFQQAKESICGIEIILRLLEEYPSQLSDIDVRTLATAIKDMTSNVAIFMQGEINRQEKELIDG